MIAQTFKIKYVANKNCEHHDIYLFMLQVLCSHSSQEQLLINPKSASSSMLTMYYMQKQFMCTLGKQIVQHFWMEMVNLEIRHV